MNKFKQKYIEWLRENEKKQVVGKFRTADGRCCAEGAVAETLRLLRPDRVTPILEGYMIDGWTHRDTLPSGLTREFGLEWVNLISLNDMELMTFAEIADYIETQDAMHQETGYSEWSIV